MTTALQRVRDGHTYAADTNLTVKTCPICGVVYAVPTTMHTAALAAGHHKICWHCPNGHELGYPGPSDEEADRDRARAAAAEANRRAVAERDLREHVERQLAAQKGATTKARKRAAAAVCPVDGCGRSFVQLRRHLATKHPDYKPDASVAEPPKDGK